MTAKKIKFLFDDEDEKEENRTARRVAGSRVKLGF